ncbi:MAG: DUF6599 family protein [Candidatus Zixiibacteriota bacterium]
MDCYNYFNFILNKKNLILIFFIFILLVLFSCDKKKSTPVRAPYDIESLSSMPFYADTLLAGNIDSIYIAIADSVSVIRPGEAANYLGKSAEQYLTYHMVGMAKAKYITENNTLYAEIIQFTDNTFSYGFYANIRPDGIAVEKRGAESYTLGNTTYFTKGEYVVTLSLEEVNDAGRKAVDNISKVIEKKINAQNSRPQFFMLFPFSGKISPSAKFYPYQFLSIPGLEQVYTTSYLLESDTLRLFLTFDKSGEKYLHIKEYAESIGKTIPDPKGFSFERNYSIAFNHPDYGVIVAGIVQGKLVGVIGYNPIAHKRLATSWIKGLK